MTAEATEDDPLIGKLVADRYRVQRKLGEGGMGVVYHAVHEALRKPVAIKLLTTSGRLDREAIGRFEREAIAAANLRHPNIAEATDFGKLPDGGLYLVMEFVEGTTLRKLLREKGRLAPERALAILQQVASALKAAHARDVVHRDLKPENVIVSGDGADVVKVIDFGIAKIRNATFGGGSAVLTKAGTVFGTPEYMAPEQVVGQAVDARGDQYALGVLAFELFTGKPPFSAPDMGQLMMMHVGAPIPSSRERQPALPVAVDAVLAKMLAKLPDERFASVGDAIQALAAAFAGAPASIVEAASGLVSGSTVKLGGSGRAGTVVQTGAPSTVRSAAGDALSMGPGYGAPGASLTGAQRPAAPVESGSSAGIPSLRGAMPVESPSNAAIPSLRNAMAPVESPSNASYQAFAASSGAVGTTGQHALGATNPALGATGQHPLATTNPSAQAPTPSTQWLATAHVPALGGAYASGSLPQATAPTVAVSVPEGALPGAPGDASAGAQPSITAMLKGPKRGTSPFALGIAVASLLAGVLLLVLFARSCGHVESSSPEMTAAMNDWKAGRFDSAGSAISAAVKKDPDLAKDATLTQTLAGGVTEESGYRVLSSLLGSTALGTSPAMASALVGMAMKDDAGSRDGALELLRERQNLLTKEQGARVRLRDAEDCEALDAAATEETEVATPATQRDLERLRSGDCRMLRQRELCGACSGGRGGGKGPGKGRGKDKGRRPDD